MAMCLFGVTEYLIKKLPVPTKRAKVILIKVISCNAFLVMLLVYIYIRSYLKSVLRSVISGSSRRVNKICTVFFFYILLTVHLNIFIS